ncbi:MAG: hypothetical protein ACOC4Z_03055 [Patescibacteria group bacterium]
MSKVRRRGKGRRQSKDAGRYHIGKDGSVNRTLREARAADAAHEESAGRSVCSERDTYD